MSYVDGFVLAVPSENRERFRAMAAGVARIFTEHGALRVVECWGDDVPDGKVTDLKRAVQAKPGEIVVFSWVEWPSKEARDAGNGKIAADPRLVPDPADADIMDPKRMIFGGFMPIVDEGGGR
ncbi:DUF1428 domain-containing protein [Sphingomonas cannabina]|uniref:DUF1428 domain-containing protein n=1 Tax=Sphingomonas cannabina TaxID=2899123 RepID=UPI001F2B03EB|nr:DUF1428 domain-containing protein [Sphingomonas cannabina]UIJ45613.1 DUF1428 domain-containing protein [Sphingomonas cannabina]